MLGILVWQEGGDYVGLLIALGALALWALARWLVRRHREGKVTLLDPDLFRHPHFRLGVSGQMLQNITLGGAMIALPIFLQIKLEYNAMQTGLSLAPLSLTMFATAILAGKTKRAPALGERHPARVRAQHRRHRAADPDRPSSGLGLGSAWSAGRRRSGTGPAGVPAQQLHAGPHRRGADQ